MSVIKATLIFSIATYLDVILNPLMGFITDSFTELSLEASLDEEDSLIYIFRLCFFLSNALGKEYEFLLLSYNLYSF